MNRFARQHDSERQHSITGGAHGEVDLPFPNKPVIHKRPLRTQIPLNLHDFEKISLLPQQQGIREITKSLHSKKYSQNLLSGERHIDREIQIKKLMLQEKLLKTAEKIRETIQRNVADTAAGFHPGGGEESENRGQAEQEEIYTKTRISECQRRESLKSKDATAGESLLDDLKKKKQDERIKDRFRNEAQHCIWEISGHRTEREPRLQNMNEPSSRKRDEKDCGIWKESNERYRKHCEVSPGTWTKEKKYKERTHVNINSSDEKPIRSQKSPEKLTKGRTTENPSSTEGNLCKESTLPHASNSLQQLMFSNTTGDSLHRLPCKFCNRKFQSDRLERHVEVCEKLNPKKRQVFNSYAQRNKRLQLKAHFKSKAPAVSQLHF